jgi:hypothetical protein
LVIVVLDPELCPGDELPGDEAPALPELPLLLLPFCDDPCTVLPGTVSPWTTVPEDDPPAPPGDDWPSVLLPLDDEPAPAVPVPDVPVPLDPCEALRTFRVFASALFPRPNAMTAAPRPATTARLVVRRSVESAASNVATMLRSLDDRTRFRAPNPVRSARPHPFRSSFGDPCTDIVVEIGCRWRDLLVVRLDANICHLA